MIVLLLAFSLCYDPKRRFFVCSQRVFWRCSALLLSGALGGIGFGFVTGAVTGFLGLPGYAALFVLSRI